jgi:hypothetical protein
MTEVASVYCSVRTGSLKMMRYILPLKGKYDLEKDLMTEASRPENNYNTNDFMYYGYFV